MIQLQPLPKLREAILSNYPVLEQSRTNVQEAEATLKHQRSLRVPQPVLYSEYEHQPDLTFWRAGVTIPLPLWDRRRGQIQEATASIRESTAMRDQRQLEILSALERAFEQYQPCRSAGEVAAGRITARSGKRGGRGPSPHITLESAALLRCWMRSVCCKACVATFSTRNMRVSRLSLTLKNSAQLPPEEDHDDRSNLQP